MRNNSGVLWVVITAVLAVAMLAALLMLVGWWIHGVVEAYHVSITTPIVEAAEPVPEGATVGEVEAS